MAKDYIVDEIRRVREEQASKCAFDVKGHTSRREEATTPVGAEGRFARAEEEIERLTRASIRPGYAPLNLNYEVDE